MKLYPKKDDHVSEVESEETKYLYTVAHIITESHQKGHLPSQFTMPALQYKNNKKVEPIKLLSC